MAATASNHAATVIRITARHTAGNAVVASARTTASGTAVTARWSALDFGNNAASITTTTKARSNATTRVRFGGGD